jgi:anti-anti-sigma factor
MNVQYHIQQAAPGISVVVLAGQLTQGKAPTEIEYLIMENIRDGARKLVVDLTELTFIDSSGLGMLVTCAGVMKKQGGKLVVAGAAGKVGQMFEITGLKNIVGLYADLPSAVEGFSAPPPPASQS